MHSTIKNPKYKTNCAKNNSDDELEQAHGARKNRKLHHLCIDIEMAESVRDFLSSPDICNSTLLDVTIIKPSDAGKPLKTNTMKGNHVRKLLSTMDRAKRDKLLLTELFEDKVPSEDTIVRISKHNPRRKMQAASDMCYEKERERKFLKSQSHRPGKPRVNLCTNAPTDPMVRRQMYSHCYSPGVMQVSTAIGENCPKPSPSEDSYSEEANLPSHNYKCGDQKRTQHVYAAPRTFKDLNSIITCQSMSKDDRTPCLCEHCGIASLLSETQKRPIITAPVEHVSELRRKMNRKEYKDSCKHEYRKRKSESCDENVQAGMAHLFERIKQLEERMDLQEERAVPKDYFKRIITKIISHFSPKNTYRNEAFQLRDSDSSSYIVEPRYKNKYSVNTLLVDKDRSKNKINEKIDHENLKKLLSNLTENLPENKRTEFAENFWKWGGEILKPGVDLKNKILSLLELNQEKDQKLDDRPKTQETCRETKKLKDTSSNRSLPESKEFNSEAFKSFVEAMSAKIYKSHKKDKEEHNTKKELERIKSSGQTLSDSSLYKKPERENEQKIQKKNTNQKGMKKDTKTHAKNINQETTKNVNVSYMNPKLSTWQEEESQISFRLEFSDADTNTRSTKDAKNRDLERLEFLRTLSRTKDSDKEKLWESIWAQAKSNGQTKQDKVTIQLPRRNGSDFNDMIEIEFTIGEIEYMLTKHKYSDKNKSKS